MRYPLILLCAGFLSQPAYTHSWYPQECCSKNDCMPADEVVRTADGRLIAFIRQHEIWIPKDFPVRASPDGGIHVCLGIVATPEEGVVTGLVCLFMPNES